MKQEIRQLDYPFLIRDKMSTSITVDILCQAVVWPFSMVYTVDI